MHKFYNSRGFQFFAITIISVLCLLLDKLTRINFTNIELPKNRPVYNAKGVDGRVYNKTGKLMYNLTSMTAWEYPNDEKIYLANLEFNIFNESSDAIKYKITSNDGWIDHANKLGFLGENTKVTVYEIKNNVSSVDNNIYLSGRNINLNLDKNTFTSKDNIVVKQGQNSLYSQGFSYDRQREYLVLESSVKAIYTKTN